MGFEIWRCVKLAICCSETQRTLILCSVLCIPLLWLAACRAPALSSGSAGLCRLLLHLPRAHVTLGLVRSTPWAQLGCVLSECAHKIHLQRPGLCPQMRDEGCSRLQDADLQRDWGNLGSKLMVRGGRWKAEAPPHTL